jgi:hypothetical protein
VERHNLDVLSLFSGIVFVAVALVGLTGAVVINAADLRWLGPLAIIGFGIVLVATAGSTKRDEPATDDGSVDDDATEPQGASRAG